MACLHEWFQTSPGQYLLEWEQAQFDAALADVFGYHALQLGQVDIDALRTNRMPHRWLALRERPVAAAQPETSPDRMPPRWAVITDPTALPFAEASLDLVVLPHTLEQSSDPHAALREVQRVLVHEGRVAIAGLSPLSLWGIREQRARFFHRFGGSGAFLPDYKELIGHRRLRDWLHLLEFELESISFGCYRPAVRSAGALSRFRWMDKLGRRWWPIFGAAYFIVAVKRTHGAKLVGQHWRKAPAVVGAPIPIANCTAPAPTMTEKKT